MNNNSITYIGIDVDDKFFHVAGYEPNTQEKLEFKVKATKSKLLKKLKEIMKKGTKIKVCYEASYIGFDLYRTLIQNKIECDVIVPSLIPQIKGRKQKTDKIDSRKLAFLYAKEMLVKVDIPTKEEEQNRQLVRSRAFLVKTRKKLKQFILSECRLLGIDYKEDTSKKTYWTKTHLDWMHKKIKEEDNKIFKETMKILLYQLEMINISISEAEKNIIALSESKKYKEKVMALKTFRGIDVLSAMIILTEIRDIKRFSHPKYLTSYAGMDITEYSSGGKSQRYGISKMGNKRIRSVLVESCQVLNNYQLISRRLERDRKEADKDIVSIAERCGERLRKKHTKMRIAGKHNNKIKVACAREMLCFIWEALQKIEEKNI